MIGFENTLTINKPSDEVFDYLSKMENLSIWNYAILDTRKHIGNDENSTNDIYLLTRNLFGRNVTELFKINEIIRPLKIQIETIENTGPFNYTTTYFLKETNNITILTNKIELSVGKTLKPFGGIIKSQVKKEVFNNLHVLKGVLENTSSP